MGTNALRGIAAAAAAAAVALAVGSTQASPFGTLFAAAPPPTLGVHDGRLAPCPPRPNCVSSYAPHGDQHVAPFPTAGDGAGRALQVLAEVIRGWPGATLVTVRADYLHAEFASPLFGFVDDLECVASAGAGGVHVRSASRIGYSDFSANRVRVEQLRAAFAAAYRRVST